METYLAYLETPVGVLELESTEKHLTKVAFKEDVETNSSVLPKVLQIAIQQLNDYFEGKRKKFSIPVAPEGTDFQQKVWEELRGVPYGETRSYLQLSKVLGDEKLTRAVGAANGRNPISIIIPCHRIIGSNGSLVGYAGGLKRKTWLLDFERGTRQGELF